MCWWAHCASGASRPAVSLDATDGQLHVRIGPFASLSEANAMREKLTNDGYNAVVEP